MQEASLRRRIVAVLTSPKLAIALLVGVLACCIVGVTAVRGQRAWELIFSTLWFNGMLVLLAISSAAAFFGRIWRRRLTLVTAGMILFHLCFLVLLGGVVYNGLFFFHGVLRLTEGETLSNGRPDSWDEVAKGRLFRFERLVGETTLLEMHRDYRVDGQNKRAAYEVEVEDGARRAKEVIYFTRHLDFDGVRYFPSKEGYSVLVVMSGKDGQEIYGAHIPLQSLIQADGSYLYATGTARAAAAFPFPAPPGKPVTALKLYFRPNTVVDRAGEVTFEVWPLEGGHSASRSAPIPIGGSFDSGSFVLSPREIRYWVGMSVRYDPGLGVILGSLVAGLLGMALTLVGRIRQGRSRRAAA